MSIVVADSGSTKTHWVIIKDDLTEAEYYGNGINPYVHSSDEIYSTIERFKMDSKEDVESVFFYGAGCSSQDVIKKVKTEFEKNSFINVQVSHDLLAASRALFGERPGIACILGTGSNSALYDGNNIIDNLPALGYIAGDEGGGVDLGKRLLSGIFKRRAPQTLIDKFQSAYDLTPSKVLNAIHFGESPNRFLASFSPFIKDNLATDYMYDLVRSSFQSFMDCNVIPYQNRSDLEIGFVGSISFHFQEILREVIKENNLNAGRVLQRPMSGLIQYHKNLLA